MKSKKCKLKKFDGITLISLVVTIIILLIIAGIGISITIGENRILKKAQQGREKYKEAAAREKLELALVDLQAQKVLDSTYNETTYIDNYLVTKQMAVIGNKVTVDGWQFEIDRNVPKIVIGLGKGQVQESTTINIKTAITNATDYTKATIKIEITSDENIGSIQINGEEIAVPSKVDGKYIIEKEVQNNGNYIINVKNTKNEYKIVKAEVTEISEDMDIQTEEQLVAFRDRVNKGATYKERTIRLVNDLNLSVVCGETNSWEPIGNYISETNNKPFSGTFEGNNHIIDYLYINTTSDYQGLFGYVVNGTIRGIIIGYNSSVTGGSYTGGISGCIFESTIQNCGNNGNISGKDSIGGIIGEADNSNIESCYNKADIISTNYCAGGIVGSIWQEKQGEHYLKNSYNDGNITGSYNVGGITGSSASSTNSNILVTLSNCYNKGIIKATNSGRIGGIAGGLGCNGLMEYCYNLGKIDNSGATNSINVGGLVGVNKLPEGAESDVKSVINYCYNKADVISTTSIKSIGGLAGKNNQNCYVKNSQQLVTAVVKNNTTTASGRMGTSSNNYTGRLIGQCYDANEPYIDTVYQSNEEDMPTVYNVVNGLSDEKSAYWRNDDVNAPRLLWEK